MIERNITITLSKAREWYKQGGDLKKVALQAFKEEELEEFNFRKITTFKQAYDYLVKHKMRGDLIDDYCSNYSPYIHRICVYRIIVAALTNDAKVSLTKGVYYYPIIQICQEGYEERCIGKKIVGKIRTKEEIYTITGGSYYISGSNGVSNFDPFVYINSVAPYCGLLAVPSKDIAEHISKYFGKLVFDILYEGTNCKYEWIA